MRTFLLFFCLVSVNLWGFDFNVVESSIAKIDDEFVFVKDEPAVVVGASGVVVKQIKNATSIISRASVVGREGGFLKLKLKEFTMLEQKALPTLDVKVEVYDKVLLNFLYDRALLIAPDEASYKGVAQSLGEVYFMHPDILGAYMVREFKLSPKRKDFALFCSNNALGMVGFVLEKSVKFVDCQDFTPLFEQPLNSSAKKPQTPFYSNITAYRKNVFNVSEKRIENYYDYYKQLLAGEK